MRGLDSKVTRRRKQARGTVWRLSKLTTHGVGTPSSLGVSSSSDTKPRLASRRTRSHPAASSQSVQSSAGPQSAIPSSDRSESVKGARAHISASCSLLKPTRCRWRASRRISERSIPSASAQRWTSAASSSDTRKLSIVIPLRIACMTDSRFAQTRPTRERTRARRRLSRRSRTALMAAHPTNPTLQGSSTPRQPIQDRRPSLYRPMPLARFHARGAPIPTRSTPAPAPARTRGWLSRPGSAKLRARSANAGRRRRAPPRPRPGIRLASARLHARAVETLDGVYAAAPTRDVRLRAPHTPLRRRVQPRSPRPAWRRDRR